MRKKQLNNLFLLALCAVTMTTIVSCGKTGASDESTTNTTSGSLPGNPGNTNPIPPQTKTQVSPVFGDYSMTLMKMVNGQVASQAASINIQSEVYQGQTYVRFKFASPQGPAGNFQYGVNQPLYMGLGLNGLYNRYYSFVSQVITDPSFFRNPFKFEILFDFNAGLNNAPSQVGVSIRDCGDGTSCSTTANDVAISGVQKR